jgi:hypothetical protein
VEPAQVHGPAQHAHILLAIGSIQCSYRFVPELSFQANAFTLPHVGKVDVGKVGEGIAWRHPRLILVAQ